MEFLWQRTKLVWSDDVLSVMNCETKSVQEVSANLVHNAVRNTDYRGNQFLQLMAILRDSTHTVIPLKRMFQGVCADVDFDDLLDVAKGLALRTQPQVDDFCKTNEFKFLKVKQNLRSWLYNRENTQIDQKAVDEQLDVELSMGNDNDKAILSELVKICDGITAEHPSNNFKKQKFQLFQCIQVSRCTEKWIVSIHPPGSGKSYVILLLALFYLGRGVDKVIILTSSHFLEKQLEMQIGDVIKGKNIVVGTDLVP